MADLRIGTGGIVPQHVEYDEVEQQLGLSEEATSLPEWMGFDRLENSSLAETTSITGLEIPLDASPILERLREDPSYSSYSDVDDKRFYMDVISQISVKLDDLVENRPSDRLMNLRETVNEMLELYETAYSHQIANVKG